MVSQRLSGESAGLEPVLRSPSRTRGAGQTPILVVELLPPLVLVAPWFVPQLVRDHQVDHRRRWMVGPNGPPMLAMPARLDRSV